MTANDSHAEIPSRSELPALVGNLGSEYEESIGGGGSKPKDFVPPSEVQDIFRRGLEQLSSQLQISRRNYHIPVTIARIRLRSNAIAKSHRHEALFSRFQVAGVQKPGEIMAVVTQRSLNGINELVEHASQRQLSQLSSVEEVTPYIPSISPGDTRSVLTFFDGRMDDGSSLQRHGIDDFNARGFQIKQYGKNQHNYTAESLPATKDLVNMPWLRQIRPVSKFKILARLSSQPIRLQRISPMLQPLPIPIVGIFDSGIDTSIAWLNRLVVAQENHIPAVYSALDHGTLVGALAASGGGFTQDASYFPIPVARLLDIQLLGSGIYENIDEDDLIIQVEDAVIKYGPRAISRPTSVDEPVVVWNLSLGGELPTSEDTFSLVAMELDRIAQENQVIFTIAAGNYTHTPLRSWIMGNGPSPIPNGNDRISSPADSALSISVGSLSDTSNPPTAAPAECPSPFSRRGPGPGMLVKPDLVHYGGTCGEYREPVRGILGPHRNGTSLEDIGTSFSTPRVASQLAQLVGMLPNPEPELLKLLLLLSCISPGDHDISKRESVNYYGFGVPENPSALLSCNPWECIVLLSGQLRPGLTLQTDFPYPPSLEEDGKRRGYIRIGLVYTPFLDPSKGSEYCQTNISASFGRKFDYPEKDPRRYRREVPPLPQDTNIGSQFERDLIEHGWKWSPTKVYERNITRMKIHPKEIGWRLSLEILLRRELEERRFYVRQPFWIGIRIVDPEHRSPIYQEMRNQINILGLAQPVILRTRIQP